MISNKRDKDRDQIKQFAPEEQKCKASIHCLEVSPDFKTQQGQINASSFNRLKRLKSTMPGYANHKVMVICQRQNRC